MERNCQNLERKLHIGRNVNRIKVKKGTVLQEFGELNTKVYHVHQIGQHLGDSKGRELILAQKADIVNYAV